MKYPQETIPPISKKSIALIISGLLIGILAINYLFVILLEFRQPNQGYWLIKQKWEWILNSRENVHTLFLGDSACNQGLIPNVYSNITGHSAYNLGTIGDMSLLNDAWMLQSYLQNHKPPQQVVVMHTFDAWNRPYMISCLAQIPCKSYSFSPMPRFSYIDWMNLHMDSWFPLFYQNYSIKSMILNPIAAFSHTYSITNGYFCVPDANPPLVIETYQKHIQELTNQPHFELLSYQKEAIQTIIQLAEQHHFDLRFLIAPVYEKLGTHPSFLEYTDQIHANISQLSPANNSDIQVIENIEYYPIESLESDDHLAHQSALSFTTALAEQLLKGSYNNSPD